MPEFHAGSSARRACVIYASTSGSTRSVAHLIAGCSAIEVDLVDLAEWDDWAPRIYGKRYSLAFLGTPTYGQGNWHYLWDKHSHEVATAISRSRQIALFALGDARGHKRSFAGGLSPLNRFFRQSGFPICGKTTPERFTFESSPALAAGHFPGFVIDFKREHRHAESLVRIWMTNVADEAGKCTAVVERNARCSRNDFHT
ncbi:flavodoxin domain-containing protein [Bradyrhizobium sp. UFLA05-112]